MKSVPETVQYLREIIQKSVETVERKKSEGKDYMYALGKGSAAHDALLMIGAKIEVDQPLAIECELLIPKGNYWAGHELNRTLHYYRKYAKENDWTNFIQCERTLRQVLMKARWEVAKSFEKIS